MKKESWNILIAVVCVILICVISVCLSYGQESAPVSTSRMIGNYKCTGYVTKHVDSSTAYQLSVTTSMEATTKIAFISVESGAVRFFRHNVNPTATLGIPVVAGNYINLLSREQINKFRVIAQSTHADLTIEFCE